ncbi:MAG: virulence RhuM family protein [Fidelibacterota bacterium]
MNNSEIIIYKSEDRIDFQIDVRIEDETVWLSQAQMVELFDATKQNISLHINNIFREGELNRNSVVKEYLTTAKDGKKYNTKLYNLDVIISVGYRVKSKRGTQFRIWANKVLKDYLLKGYPANNRIDRVERDVHLLNKRVDVIDFQLQTNLPPAEGIFYDGQIFDAYTFVSDIIKSAKNCIILIDNYIDESVLMILSKRRSKVSATIYTKSISNRLQLDLKKHHEQYPPIEVRTFDKSHDRFLILDETKVYHFGASLKDLGKKWFAFSKIKLNAPEIIEKLNS